MECTLGKNELEIYNFLISFILTNHIWNYAVHKEFLYMNQTNSYCWLFLDVYWFFEFLDYVTFLKRVMKQLQSGYNTLREVEIDIRFAKDGEIYNMPDPKDYGFIFK